MFFPNQCMTNARSARLADKVEFSCSCDCDVWFDTPSGGIKHMATWAEGNHGEV